MAVEVEKDFLGENLMAFVRDYVNIMIIFRPVQQGFLQGLLVRGLATSTPACRPSLGANEDDSSAND